MCSSIAAWDLKACQPGSCSTSSLQGPGGLIESLYICRLLLRGGASLVR